MSLDSFVGNESFTTGSISEMTEYFLLTTRIFILVVAYLRDLVSIKRPTHCSPRSFYR